MKRIISIILLSATLFANELEVDGGITATGEIQSPTIQALLEQIAQLQEQIALLQAQLNTSNSNVKIATYNVENLSQYQTITIDLNDLFGFDVGLANISVLGINNCSNLGTDTSKLQFMAESDNYDNMFSNYLKPDCTIDSDIYSYQDKLYLDADDSDFTLRQNTNHPNDVSFDIHFILTTDTSNE
tara:strand:- start:3324 stop:3881 length:558 start_codon:yes stop_codon:yes gene_type:complete